MRRFALAALAVVAFAVTPVACGARTPLGADESASPPSAAAPVDAGAKDARADAKVDAHPDALPIEAGPPCTSDDQCPLSYGCVPEYGCQARALASAPDGLYEVLLPSGITRKLTDTAHSYLDVALAHDRTLYGASDALYAVDVAAGTDSLLQAIPQLNALDVAPDGTLYGAAGTSFYVVDRGTGSVNAIATFPNGFTSSGDIAFLGGRMLATAAAGNVADGLVEVDLATDAVKVIGDIGFGCVYGLAAFGKDLYGLTCTGGVIAIDPVTGAGKLLARSGVTFYGATAR